MTSQSRTPDRQTIEKLPTGTEFRMKRDDKRHVALLIAAAVFIYAFYIWHSYTSIFESRKAFIYHPESDQLIELKLGFHPTERDTWKPFIPFTSIRHMDPDYARKVGTFTESLADYRAEQQRFENDPETYWDEEWVALSNDLETAMKAIESGDYPTADDLLGVDWIFRRHDEPREQIRETFSAWVSSEALERMVVDWVDVVLVRFDDQNGEPPRIEILDGAILLRGLIVLELDDLVTGFPAREMREGEKLRRLYDR